MKTIQTFCTFRVSLIAIESILTVMGWIHPPMKRRSLTFVRQDIVQVSTESTTSKLLILKTIDAMIFTMFDRQALFDIMSTDAKYVRRPTDMVRSAQRGTTQLANTGGYELASPYYSDQIPRNFPIREVT